MAGYLGEFEAESSAMHYIKLYEIFVFAPFLLYLATKTKPVTRAEQQFLLGNAGLLGLVNGISFFQE